MTPRHPGESMEPPIAKHAAHCDVATGKHKRGSWDDLELPGDCTCGLRPDPPVKGKL